MRTNNITAALLLALSALTVSSCGSNPLKKTTPQKSAVKVRVIDIQPKNSDSQKTYIAKSEAAKSVTLTSPLPATLKSIKVRQGDKVQAGQAIATVYSESAENSLAAAKATLRQAQDAYDRIASVKDNGSVAPMKIIEVETALEKAKSVYNLAQKNISDCTIKAPYSGTITEVMADEGVDVNISQPIAKIADLDKIEIIISIPESEIGQMTIGKQATLTVPALGDAQYEVKVVRKGVSSDALSHSYECALAPASQIEGLMPGMVGKIVFKQSDSSKNQQIIIPSSAVKIDVDSKYVWTVNSDGKVEKTLVKTGGFAGKGVIITEGLAQGDKLIVDGCSKVSTGMNVEIEY